MQRHTDGIKRSTCTQMETDTLCSFSADSVSFFLSCLAIQSVVELAAKDIRSENALRLYEEKWMTAVFNLKPWYPGLGVNDRVAASFRSNKLNVSQFVPVANAKREIERSRGREVERSREVERGRDEGLVQRARRKTKDTSRAETKANAG